VSAHSALFIVGIIVRPFNQLTTNLEVPLAIAGPLRASRYD